MKMMSLKSADLIEPDTEKFKPCFVTKPEPEEVNEGQCARFVCRVTGYPKPRVMWLLNGHTVINVSLQESCTDFPAYSDTVYSDTLLTVTLLECPK